MRAKNEQEQLSEAYDRSVESKYERVVRLVNELIDENSEQSENTLYHIRDLLK
tara:strand:+ start:220 stop:378 length:159 start_codon:yes stop_codon:yes gene_type:complete